MITIHQRIVDYPENLIFLSETMKNSIFRIKSTIILGILFGIAGLLVSPKAFATEYIDVSTKRSDMHACQRGDFMTGVDVGENRLSCTPDYESLMTEPIFATENSDATTQKLGKHVCPDQMAMTGLHVGRNLLLCMKFPIPLVNETIDDYTVRNDMHTCPTGSVMTGIHVGKNFLVCQYPKKN